MANIKAILYDLDGVLVDACEWHYIALNMALIVVSACEIGRDEHVSIFNGLPTRAKLALLIQQGRIRPDQIDTIWKLKQEYTKLAIEGHAVLDTDKVLLHEECRGRFRLACVTNSIKETTLLMLERTGQLGYMELIINNEDVRHPKPNSECYVKAMVRMGLMPDECLIVEDSDKGLAAAHNTGAYVLAVKDSSEVVQKAREFLGL